MADYDQSNVTKVEEGSTVEATDRGLFDFGGKKEEEKKPQEAVICTEFDEKVQVSEPEHKHGGLLEKLHRSDSSSSSSSDEEEVEEGGEKKKKKKKKGLKEKISGNKKEEEKAGCEDIPIPIVGQDEPVHAGAPEHHEGEEKKGFLDKIKEKLPGGHKKAEEGAASPPAPVADECTTTTAEGEAKEKKGFLEKIKEKLPGYHPKAEDEKEKEKEKEAASHY